MSIQHTVVFRLVHAPDSAGEAEFLDTAARILSGIGGVQEFMVERQVSVKSELSWRFTMRFTDQPAYDAYNAHPAHVAFVRERWLPEVAAFQEFDFIAR